MNKTKHTPGPWRYNGRSHAVYGNQVSQVANLTTAATGATTIHTDANCRLIAAAPDMLLLLRKCIDEQTRCNRVSDNTIDDITTALSAIDNPPATAQP